MVQRMRYTERGVGRAVGGVVVTQRSCSTQYIHTGSPKLSENQLSIQSIIPTVLAVPLARTQAVRTLLATALLTHSILFSFPAAHPI